MAETGSFECSAPAINEIWRLAQRTLMLCMEDTFVDCPAYEQSFWIGDCRISALTGVYIFGSYDLIKRCLRLAAHFLEHSPLPEAQVPTGTTFVKRGAYQTTPVNRP